MKEKKLKNIHPGEILLEDFLKPMELSQYRLSIDSGISHASITRIIQGKQGISPEMAVKLADFFENSARFWLGLQMDYEIEEIERLKQRNRNVSLLKRKRIATKKRAIGMANKS